MCVSVCVVLEVQSLVNQGYCGRCQSNRSHSRNEWVVQAAGRGIVPGLNWQPLWGRRSKWRCHGGGTMAGWIYCYPCEASKTLKRKSTYLIISKCSATIHCLVYKLSIGVSTKVSISVLSLWWTGELDVLQIFPSMCRERLQRMDGWM